MIKRLVVTLYPVVDVIRRTIIRLARGSTLGVRAIVVDDDRRVLLVRHTYTPGWYCPGGGVRRGEPPMRALGRELNEEVGIELSGAPTLVELFAFTWAGAADFWAVYHVPQFKGPSQVQDSLEIEELAWFSIDALPEDLESRTRTILMAWQQHAS